MTNRAHDELDALLEAAGYYSGLSEGEQSELRREILTTGSVGAMSHPRKMLFCDAENLAEGGAGDWLRDELGPLLTMRGVSLPPIIDDFRDDASKYSLIVGGKERVVWVEGDEVWGASLVATFELVNQLLEAAGVEERLYAIGGGNDGQAWLLTPTQAKIIRDCGDLPKAEWPYIPINEPEWFGQPH